jgi:hypothetical protein
VAGESQEREELDELDSDDFYLDENDLEDRAGRVDQKIVGDELVLTRIPKGEERQDGL